MNSARTGSCNLDIANRPNPLHFRSYLGLKYSKSESHIHTAYLSHAIKIPVPFTSGPLGVPGSCIWGGRGPVRPPKKFPPEGKKKKAQQLRVN